MRDADQGDDVDFAESSEQREFRLKARVWIERNVADLPHRHPSSHQDREVNSRWWQERMYVDGWAGMSWPVEFGGKGLTPTEDSIFNAESALVDAPLPINLIGMNLAGPTIMAHGNDHQKERYLNRILSGRRFGARDFPSLVVVLIWRVSAPKPTKLRVVGRSMVRKCGLHLAT